MININIYLSLFFVSFPFSFSFFFSSRFFFGKVISVFAPLFTASSHRIHEQLDALSNHSSVLSMSLVV